MGNARGNDKAAMHNGIPPPSISLQLPNNPDSITTNLLLLLEQTPDPRLKILYQRLIKHLHAFIKETNLSKDEWLSAIKFLSQASQMATPRRNEMSTLSAVLGVSALIDALSNPVDAGATEYNLLGPFYTADAEDIENGGSIASEGKGEYMYVEGRVLTTEGVPIANAIIETWETDQDGLYDIQYVDQTRPDCRGRLRTGEDGSFGYRAVVPTAYPIPDDGPVGKLLLSQGRHNMRPSHIHIAVEALGYRKLVTQLYPDDCDFLASDAAFAAKTSLVVKLEQVDDEAEARKRGFPKGGSFKLLKRDFVLLTEDQSRLVRQKALRKWEECYLQNEVV